jgi:predicted alpha/beta superfamily hydrolase
MQTGSGRIVTLPVFPSRYVPARQVEIWLPPGYDEGDERYGVLYMHDGENVFNAATATHRVAWEADRAVARLAAVGAVRAVIVVAIWSGRERVSEFFPTVGLEPAPGTAAGAATADDYVAFLVEEVKAEVDATYRTLPGPAATTVVGSSRGGLISLFALECRPDVFGAAACVSMHWPAGGEALVDAMAARLPPPGRHRLWFDSGTLGLDAGYGPHQERMERHLAAAGWRRGVDVESRVYAGTGHDEAAWRARLDEVLGFLLGPGRYT